MAVLFAFLSVPTMIVLGIIAVLIFGRRLPEMAKFLGKSIIEFKKGMHGLETNFDDIANPSAAPPASPTSAPAEAVRPPQRVAPAAPKFDDVPAQPAPAAQTPPPNAQAQATNPPQP